MTDRNGAVRPHNLGGLVRRAIVDNDDEAVPNAVDLVGHAPQDGGNPLSLISSGDDDPETREPARRGVTG